MKILLFVFLTFSSSLAASPTLDDNANKLVVLSEAAHIGTLIKTVQVTDTDTNDNVVVSTPDALTSEYTFVNQTTGNSIQFYVYLRKQLDRDWGTIQIRLKFSITDNQGNQRLVQFTLHINDVNDEEPVFQQEPYTLEIPENRSPGLVYSSVSAHDRDEGYKGLVTYRMEPKSQSPATAEEYNQTFSMDHNNGHVSLLKKLDFEKNSYYQFTVFAQDNAPPYHSVSTLLIIRVLDVQDTPPFFTGIPYRTSIKEDKPVGTTVLTVSATDGDPSVSNQVAFTIEEGDCSTFFSISDDGVIKTIKQLSRDEGEIKDKSGVCSFPVKIFKSIKSSTFDTFLSKLRSSIDQRKGSKVMIQQLLMPKPAYEINGTEPQYGNTTRTTNVTIMIEDVNNNSPMFINNTGWFEAEIQENSPTGVPITLTKPSSMNIQDKDQGINSKMHVTLSTDDFIVEPNEVQDYGSLMIRVNNRSVLDYETRTNITFQVIVKEAKNQSHLTTASVLLKLIDMNDNNPLFEENSYTFYINENSNYSTDVGHIKATDLDSGTNGNVTYSLSGGNDKFRIGETDGIIRTNVVSKLLDRETIDVYYLTITATDGGDRSNATSVVIHLNDTNDNAPQFQRNEYTAFISESDTKYDITPIIIIQAHDDDQPHTDNSKVRYNITSISEPESIVQLRIDEVSGSVYLDAPVDFEKLQNNTGVSGEVKVTVEGRDLGDPSLSNTTTFILNIQDENDNKPIFIQSVFNGTVLENVTSTLDKHANVLHVFANDSDKTSRNSDLDYFIIGGSFSINSSTGDVYVQPNLKLDRERQDFYNLTVKAIDHGSPPQTGTALVYITILDVNDELPEFNKTSYSVDVKENHTSVNAVTCFAYDVDKNHDLMFNITKLIATDERGNLLPDSSLVADFFGIDPSNGSISVYSTADREVAELILLEITVLDANAYDPDPQTATTTLTVRLLDVNDNYPKFEGTNFTFSVSENAQDPSIIATIHADDSDVNRTITYNLSQGPTPTGSFSIDPGSGVLIKDGLLDRESNASVTLVVTANDSGVPSKATNVSIHIVVSDFNDNAPIFEPHNETYYVQENVTEGYIIAVINASDKDAGNNRKVFYSIKSGASGNFTINDTTGAISVLNKLDREKNAGYSLILDARDCPDDHSERKSSQTTIRIIVTDINDNAPLFDAPEYNLHVKEDVDVNFIVSRITANDGDEPGSNNSLISYEISTGNQANLFKVDSHSGAISVNSSLRSHVGNYSLTIIATDHGDPRLNGTTLVYVEVTDVNLNAPVVIMKPPGNLVKTYECARIGSKVHTFNASDADHGRNAELTYAISLTDGNNVSSPLFVIDNVTGVLTTSAKLTDKGGSNYKFQLVVSDKGDPKLSSEPYIFDVEVLDVNDHPPIFNTKNYNMTVAENQINAKVGKVIAYDLDRNSVSCYSIKDPQWSEYFHIGNISGELTTNKGLDHENVTNISLTIKVSDCSQPENRSEVCDNVTISTGSSKQSTKVHITVIDVDDNPPVFTQHQMSYGMRRTVKPESFLNLQLREGSYVTDKDTPANAKAIWTFRNNGTITTSNNLQATGEGIRACDDGIKHVFCVSKNGSIMNNKWFSESESTYGFFIVPVSVADNAGSDNATIKIYLIVDTQVLVMTIFGQKAEVVNQKDEILELFSNITGHKFVYDDVADHRLNDNTVDTLKTDLFFHVVEPGTNRILPASEAQKLVDRFADALRRARAVFRITSIVMSVRPTEEQNDGAKTIYILVAVIVVLTLTLGIIVYLSCTSASRYKRKLKAATISTTDKDLEMKETVVVPGSNQYSKQANPLLNAVEPKVPEYDSISLSSDNSLDANEVDGPRPEAFYDTMEEKEMTLDMYNDDEFIPIREEDPLSAALRLHELRRSQDTLDKSFTSDGSQPIANGHIANHEKVTIHGFENAAFDDLQHSEI